MYQSFILFYRRYSCYKYIHSFVHCLAIVIVFHIHNDSQKLIKKWKIKERSSFSYLFLLLYICFSFFQFPPVVHSTEMLLLGRITKIGTTKYSVSRTT